MTGVACRCSYTSWRQITTWICALMTWACPSVRSISTWPVRTNTAAVNMPVHRFCDTNCTARKTPWKRNSCSGSRKSVLGTLSHLHTQNCVRRRHWSSSTSQCPLPMFMLFTFCGFPFRFPNQRSYTSLVCLLCTTHPAHLMLLQLVTLIWFAEES